MEKLNYHYPFGEGLESYLEYRLSCKQCGKAIHLFLPTELTHTGYSIGGNSCHPFEYSINRGTPSLFDNKVIKLRNDTMGNSFLLFDNYHLYPLIPEEGAEERKTRLVNLKQKELEKYLSDNPAKKQWIIEELVNRNDAILNALEEVIKVYEKTDQSGWDKLDAALVDTTAQDDAISLFHRFGVEYRQTVQHIRPEPVNFFMAHSFAVDSFANNSFMQGMNNQFGVEEIKSGQPKAASQPSGEEWTCSCGTKSSKKFCPNCGTPNPGVFA